MGVFMQSIQYIHEFNQQHHEYSLALNQFADLTEEEFQILYLQEITKQVVNKQSVEYNGTAVDWEKAGKTPPVRDQGGFCGSSWAFAAVSAMEINSRISKNEAVDLSIQDLLECSQPFGNQGCRGGWMTNSYEYVLSNGIATEQDYPYKQTDTSQCKRTVKREFKIQGYTEQNGCEQMGVAIQDGAVSTAADAGKWQFYSSGIFSECGELANHAVVVVGIDENGNWKVRNTWGTSWGEQGHIRLKSGNTCGICSYPSQPII